jgi:hypothetical protein
MKNLILASLLGSAATAFAVPALTGPVHFAITRPYSLFGWLPPAPNYSATVSVSLGTAPLDFVLTDVVVGGFYDQVLVTVNGTPVLNLPWAPNTGQVQPSVHMTSGVFISAGSVIGVQATQPSQLNTKPVTLAGYVQ